MQMARWKRPLVTGEAASMLTAMPPAEWPNIVTLEGSPPNWAILFFHPLQSGYHILQPIVPRSLAAFTAEFRVCKESERTDSIGNTYQDDSLFSETHSVIHGSAGRAAAEASSVDPNDHRDLFARLFCGRPYVQVQAVFADRRGVPHCTGGLHAGAPESIRFFDAGPGLHRCGCLPAQIAHRRRCKWNPFEYRNAFGNDALHFSASHFSRLNLRNASCAKALIRKMAIQIFFISTSSVSIDGYDLKLASTEILLEMHVLFSTGHTP